MDCPQCHNNEFSSSGICLVCGYRRADETHDRRDEDARDESSSPRSVLPQWRQELSERLQAIKQKNETDRPDAAPIAAAVPIIEKPSPQPNPVSKPRQAAAGSTLRTPAPKQKILTPLAKPEAQEIKKIIDKAVSRPKIKSAEAQSSPASSFALRQKPDFYEDKLILLSRTLSGLVDLMIVALCAGAMIIACDYSSGIILVDSVSFIVYSTLFLLIYLFYSIFFLSASTQTIGMMITDLRIVGVDGQRPLFRQIFSRCIGHLLSLFLLGIGLAWSLFDGENRCFHDRLSRTQVVRI